MTKLILSFPPKINRDQTIASLKQEHIVKGAKVMISIIRHSVFRVVFYRQELTRLAEGKILSSIRKYYTSILYLCKGRVQTYMKCSIHFLPFLQHGIAWAFSITSWLQFLLVLLTDSMTRARVLFNWFSFVKGETDPRITSSTSFNSCQFFRFHIPHSFIEHNIVIKL